MLRFLYRKFRANVLHYVIPKSNSDIFADGKTAVEVVGFFHSSSGVGESARLCARQLQQNGFKVCCTSVENIFLKPKEMAWDFTNTASRNEVGCRIIHLNPPMIPPAMLGMGLLTSKKVPAIGYWAWEVEEIPSEWKKALRYTSAVFCPSNFTSNVIRKYTDKPVMTVPHPVCADTAVSGMRERLRISKEAFLVSSVFSFGSGLERKNPDATISAFKQAFVHGEDAYLLLKCNHGDHSYDKERVLEAIEGYKNIRLIDDVWDKPEIMGLIKESDLYASLHCSEGFGLPIAEAMRQGTPAMVTNWSGNTDFCNEKNSFLIDYDMVPVDSEHAEFKELTHSRWAYADVAHAAETLRYAYHNRDVLKQKAAVCLQHSNDYFSQPGYVHALKALANKKRIPA